MSEVQASGAFGAARTTAGIAPTPVHAAIARAAEATGVDFNYLLAQARLESSLDPRARASTSSAAGLYQFTNGTWVDTLGRHGAEHGLSWISEAIQGGGMANPQMRAQVMGLRFDPQVSALMAAELASDNRDALSAQLGREPDAAELYLAHFLGSGGAGQFLSALAEKPGQSAAAILPRAAAANRGIFYAGGAPRSVAGVMDLMRAKVSGAMEVGGVDGAASLAAASALAPQLAYEAVGQDGWQPLMGPIAREFHAARPVMPAPASTAPLTAAAGSTSAPVRSMAETLEATFGGVTGAAPTHVRSAYAKLARFGL